MNRWVARIVVVLLALIGWYVAPIVAALQLVCGNTARQRAMRAADYADRTLNALTGNSDRWLSEGAANYDGPGWRILRGLLDTGWPGHLDIYRRH